MSYDIRLGVKVEGAKDLIAVIAEPDLSSPTYNLGKMFRAAMQWDFSQGEWYKVSEVMPHIERGIHELSFNEKAYKKYSPLNGEESPWLWGTTNSALEVLQSLEKCISDNVSGKWTGQKIPIECLYMRW